MGAPPPLPPGKVRRSLSRGEKVAIVLACLILGAIAILGLMWLVLYIFGLMLTGGGGAGGN